MRNLLPYLWISLGAVLGANARYLVNRGMVHVAGVDFPWATFAVNVAGSFAIGLVGTLLAERLVPNAEVVRQAVIVGFLGSLTTFSSLTWETTGLLNNAAWLRAGLNIVLSVAVGLMAVRLGEMTARTIATPG